MHVRQGHGAARPRATTSVVHKGAKVGCDETTLARQGRRGTAGLVVVVVLVMVVLVRGGTAYRSAQERRCSVACKRGLRRCDSHVIVRRVMMFAAQCPSSVREVGLASLARPASGIRRHCSHPATGVVHARVVHPPSGHVCSHGRPCLAPTPPRSRPSLADPRSRPDAEGAGPSPHGVGPRSSRS